MRGVCEPLDAPLCQRKHACVVPSANDVQDIPFNRMCRLLLSGGNFCISYAKYQIRFSDGKHTISYYIDYIKYRILNIQYQISNFKP